jgi:hypothetical protein
MLCCCNSIAVYVYSTYTAAWLCNTSVVLCYITVAYLYSMLMHSFFASVLQWCISYLYFCTVYFCMALLCEYSISVYDCCIQYLYSILHFCIALRWTSAILLDRYFLQCATYCLTKLVLTLLYQIQTNSTSA